MQRRKPRQVCFTRKDKRRFRPNFTTACDEACIVAADKVFYGSLFINNAASLFNSARQSADQPGRVKAGPVGRVQSAVHIRDADALRRLGGCDQLIAVAEAETLIAS